MRNMEHLQAWRRERISVYKQMFCGAEAARGELGRERRGRCGGLGCARAGAVVVREGFFREIGERLAYVKKKW